MITRFADIAGHDSSLRVLRRSLADRRLHHSLIFHGPVAVGKRTVARALAAALNCEKRGDDACGTCVSCLKVEKEIHPDVVYRTLERTVIPIDAIRSLRQEAAYRPYEGNARVFIIDPADRLSTDAQNALLKTLEEPSTSSVIILITSRPMHLLATTRSRCQSLAFGTLPYGALAAILSDRHGFPLSQAERVARLSGGRYGAALGLNLEEHDARREALLQVLGRLAEPLPRAHVLDDASSFGDDAEEISASLTLLAGLVRDMMVLAAGASGADDAALVHADRAADLGALCERFSPGLGAIQDRIRMASTDIDRNVNRKLLVETLLFDIAQSATSS